MWGIKSVFYLQGTAKQTHDTFDCTALYYGILQCCISIGSMHQLLGASHVGESPVQNHEVTREKDRTPHTTWRAPSQGFDATPHMTCWTPHWDLMPHPTRRDPSLGSDATPHTWRDPSLGSDATPHTTWRAPSLGSDATPHMTWRAPSLGSDATCFSTDMRWFHV